MIMRHLGVRFRKTRVVYAGEWIRGDGKSNGRKGVPYSGLTGIRKDGGSEPGKGEGRYTKWVKKCNGVCWSENGREQIVWKKTPGCGVPGR